jgi:hypothetical protein
MNAALRNAMTVDEYVALSDRQSERRRTELINGQIATMPADDRTVTHYARTSTPHVIKDGLLRLDPPGLDLTVESLFGVA